MFFCFFLCSLLISVSMAAGTKKTITQGSCCGDPAEGYLTLLGLPKDTNDTEVIRLLDIPEKQIFAMGVIIYRRTYSAVPKLLQIVNDPNAFVPAKMCAARTLCSLGNKEWMPTIKALSTDPNSIASRSVLKIRFAGLLARGGDYSQFDIVSAAIGDSSKGVRGIAISALRNFGHKTNPVTDSAVELLLSVANTDPDIRSRLSAMHALERIAKQKPQIRPRLKVPDSTVDLLVSVATTDPKPGLRQQAIWSLIDIARKKPQIKPRLISALKANKDSQDESLRRICQIFLKVHTPNRKDQKGKQP